MIDTGTERPVPASASPPGWTGPALVATIVVTALNLRPAVVAVAPVIDEVRVDLGLSSSSASLLTTLPLVCFGLGAFVSARLERRLGMATALFGAMLVLLAGLLVRLFPSAVALFGGTIVAGLAIAVGNVLIPALIKRDFSGPAVGRMLGAETVMISAGGALSAAVMVPLQQVLGWSWRPTLALWAIAAAAAVAVWVPLLRRARRAGAEPPPTPSDLPAGPRVSLYRNALAWQVTLLMGLQSLHSYAVTTWAPSVFTDGGFSPTQGGLLLALAGAVSLPANYLTPVLAARRATQHHLVVALVVLLGAGYTGVLLAPEVGVVWMVLIGLGQGVGLSLGHTLITLRARDSGSASELSGMAQGVGYLVAAAGPLGLGVLRDLTGAWDVPFVALLIMLVPVAIAGFGGSRDRYVTPPTGHASGTPRS